MIRYNVGRVLRIDVLPDDVLLEIFDFYVLKYQDWDLRQHSEEVMKILRNVESWQSLVHVCRRWRGLVFGSSRRLNLHLFCTPNTSRRRSSDIWPALPLIIQDSVTEKSVNNVIAELEHSDRISHIALFFFTTSQIEKLWAAMQVPFPELAYLHLSYDPWWRPPILPDSFLGGSAPHLQYLDLSTIPFPGLPKLLLSATHLVNLRLHLPYSGYVSPEAMATCLSMSTSLELLRLEIEDYYPNLSFHPDLGGLCPFPPTRTVLPTLTIFSFNGANGYLQEFVARIDAPQLLSTTFSDNIDFDTPELNRFISRTPTLGAYDEARLIFHHFKSLVRIRQTHPEGSDHRMVEVKISGYAYGRHLSILAKICTLPLRLLLTMENLYICGSMSSTAIENTDLLDLLLPFTTVKNLYLSEQFSPLLAPALQELTGGRTTEVLPALETVLLEGSSHRNLSTKALHSSFLRDGSPITLLSFLSGIETSGTTRTRPITDSFPSFDSLTFRVAVLFSRLYLLFGLKTTLIGVRRE